MASILTYARLVKFSHTVFALPFAVLAAFLAGASRQVDFYRCGWFWGQLALLAVCMAAARSAAMAINRIADRKIDAGNSRTAGRALVTGELKLRQVWWFYAACSAAFLAACGAFWAIWGNYWPLVLAPAVLGFISFYSLTKRFTAASHVVLGASLGLAPLCAWIAIAPATFGLLPLAIGAAVLCWVAGFDIIYSLQDLQHDLALGLHSLPAAIGPANALWISRALHLWSFTGLVWVWRLGLPHLKLAYLAAVAAAGAVLLVEQLLVSPRNFSRAGAAFFFCNGLVSLLVGAGGIVDILMHSIGFD